MLVLVVLARLMAPAQGQGAWCCSWSANLCCLPPRRDGSCVGHPDWTGRYARRLLGVKACGTLALGRRARAAAAAVRRGAVVGRHLMTHCLVQQRDRSC